MQRLRILLGARDYEQSLFPEFRNDDVLAEVKLKSRIGALSNKLGT